MAGLKAAANEKLVDVEHKLAELTRIRDGLQTLVRSCPGHGALARCPILGPVGGVGMNARDHQHKHDHKAGQSHCSTGGAADGQGAHSCCASGGSTPTRSPGSDGTVTDP